MKTKRKLFLLASLGILFFFAFTVQSGRSAYTSDVLIDCERESAYSHVLDGSNYDVYYANSDIEHFIYMNFSYDITTSSIELTAKDFYENISANEVQTSYLQSQHDIGFLFDLWSMWQLKLFGTVFFDHWEFGLTGISFFSLLYIIDKDVFLFRIDHFNGFMISFFMSWFIGDFADFMLVILNISI
ncbi:MAG: hypothetical protein ACFFAN_02830 [Promethearchaeota archaeon]